jgi:hypothetical protein
MTTIGKGKTDESVPLMSTTSTKSDSNAGINDNNNNSSTIKHHHSAADTNKTDMDDVDMELYGHINTNTATDTSIKKQNIESNDMDIVHETDNYTNGTQKDTDSTLVPVQKTYWCLLYLEDGSLEVS